MGDLFTITSDIRNIATTAFTDLIIELGKDCRLYYDPTIVECANCYFDEATGRSSNQYKPGGPVSFSDGMVCPVCGSKGLLETENTEVIRLLLDKDPKYRYRNDFYTLNNIRMPQFDISSKGFLTDLPKIQKCRYMVAQISLEPYIVEKYVLVGTPTDTSNIVQNKFFAAGWRRITE